MPPDDPTTVPTTPIGSSRENRKTEVAPRTVQQVVNSSLVHCLNVVFLPNFIGSILQRLHLCWCKFGTADPAQQPRSVRGSPRPKLRDTLGNAEVKDKRIT